ncbi:MAG: alpha/beta hydrolase [Mycobacterium sp.]
MSTHIVVLPGGGYSSHTAHESEPIVDWLESLGYSASVFRYPLQARHPGPLDAVREEIVARRRDADHVGVMGFSAGGHLAGHAALAPDSTAEQRPDFAVLGYPITSMELPTYRSSQDILLGDSPSDQDRFVTSLDRLVTPGAPPMFLWHTAEDSYVAVEHSYRLASALAAAGRPHCLHVFAHGPHGLGLAHGAGQAEGWTSLAAGWLAEQA